jgi:hypothetical protein
MIRFFREMQLFLSTVLTHRQRLLLLFQRKLLINEFGESRHPIDYDKELYDIR